MTIIQQHEYCCEHENGAEYYRGSWSNLVALYFDTTELRYPPDSGAPLSYNKPSLDKSSQVLYYASRNTKVK